MEKLILKNILDSLRSERVQEGTGARSLAESMTVSKVVLTMLS